MAVVNSRLGWRPRLAGLIMIGAALPAVSNAASFDCSRASTADERAICSQRALNDKDVQLATPLNIAAELVAMGQRSDLMDQQRTWLQNRRACVDNLACLNRSYDQRLKEVQSVIDAIKSGGPY